MEQTVKSVGLEKKINTFFQTKGNNIRAEPTLSQDLRRDDYKRPFAVGYFKTLKELPLAWHDCGETGTSGSIYQKDD